MSFWDLVLGTWKVESKNYDFSDKGLSESIPINELTVNPAGEKINPQCFSILKVLGKGGYGKVRFCDCYTSFCLYKHRISYGRVVFCMLLLLEKRGGGTILLKPLLYLLYLEISPLDWFSANLHNPESSKRDGVGLSLQLDSTNTIENV